MKSILLNNTSLPPATQQAVANSCKPKLLFLLCVILALGLLFASSVGGVGLFPHSPPPWLAEIVHVIGQPGTWTYWVMMIGGGLGGLGAIVGGVYLLLTKKNIHYTSRGKNRSQSYQRKFAPKPRLTKPPTPDLVDTTEKLKQEEENKPAFLENKPRLSQKEIDPPEVKPNLIEEDAAPKPVQTKLPTSDLVDTSEQEEKNKAEKSQEEIHPYTKDEVDSPEQLRAKEQVEQSVQHMCSLMKEELGDLWTQLTLEQMTVISLYVINYQAGLLMSEQSLLVPSDILLTPAAKRIEAVKREEILGILQKIHQGKQALFVTASKDQIIDYYLKYNRLIVLRPLQSDCLVLGCGWGMCRSDYKNNYQNPDKFVHKDVDTVNILLQFNPSVICFWGDEKQCALFEKRYKFIYDEGPIVNFIEDKEAFYRCCRSAFAPSDDSYLILGNHLFSLSSFSSQDIDMIKPPVHFEEYAEWKNMSLATYAYHPRIYRLRK